MHYYLSLGSNKGDKLNNLKEAVEGLLSYGIIIKKSSVYKTEPYGVKEQDDFFNVIVTLESELQPQVLLDRLKKLEKKIGRQERPRWHEREIDIDIIEYDGEPVKTVDLYIPHPEFENRRFVLLPLYEINPHFQNRKKMNIKDMIRVCPDTGRAERYLLNW